RRRSAPAAARGYVDATTRGPRRADRVGAMTSPLGPVVDGHNDYAWQLRKHGIDPDMRTDLSRDGLHTDLPRLRRGGVAAQFWSVYVPCGDSEPASTVAVLEQIDLVRR